MSYKVDSKNLGMLGISEAEYQKFRAELDALNKGFTDRFQADAGPDMGYQDIRFGSQPAARTPSKAMQDEYQKAFFGLTSKYGIKPVVEGTDKVYYLDHGSSLFNPYGKEARFNDTPGTRPGWYTRDSRTEGDFQYGDALKAIVKTVTNPLSYLGADPDGLGGVPVFGAIKNGLLAGSDSNYGVNVANISGYVGPDGEMPDLAEGPMNNQNPIDGLLGGGGMSIPVPGLPFPIPGGLDMGALWEIAKNSGRSLYEVIQDVMSGDGSTPAPGQPVEDDRVNQPGPGAPIQLPGGIGDRDLNDDERNPQLPPLQPFPGSPPPQNIPDDSQPEIPPPALVPGTPPGTGGSSSGGNVGGGAALALLLPGLLGMMERPDPAPTPEYQLWDYMGADGSYGYQSPDYGLVQQAPAYNFSQQPSQPSQVGYNPEPRRDFLTVADQERLRRQQLGLL